MTICYFLTSTRSIAQHTYGDNPWRDNKMDRSMDQETQLGRDLDTRLSGR